VLRGGSFYDDQSDLRCAARFSYDPNYPGWLLGFRVCADD
jgi:formylglycine-generating enzyme required for sulfatase activity